MNGKRLRLPVVALALAVATAASALADSSVRTQKTAATKSATRAPARVKAKRKPQPLRRGWADQWTPLEQMWVAERAHHSGRGYWPWPSTARSCGLI